MSVDDIESALLEHVDPAHLSVDGDTCTRSATRAASCVSPRICYTAQPSRGTRRAVAAGSDRFVTPFQTSMSTADPLTLRLPTWLHDSFDLARAIANEHRSPDRTTGPCRYDQFEMRSHERAFVKSVLARCSNLWLFRTNQRGSCGDFIAIDMSSPRRAGRRASVMELKTGDGLVIGGAHRQCARYRAAVDEIVAREILDDSSPVELLYGDGAAVLRHLGGRGVMVQL